MVDTETGVFHDVEHELHGKSLKSRVLVFPKAIGSSVGAYALYSLKTKGVAPVAVICTSTIDIITASACAISEIPAVDMKGQRYESLSMLRQGTQVLVDADGCRIELIKKH
jgi:predicted aconitase with swiveling domain